MSEPSTVKGKTEALRDSEAFVGPAVAYLDYWETRRKKQAAIIGQTPVQGTEAIPSWL